MLFIALLAVVGSVRGTVASNGPLPGAAVTLSAQSFSVSRVTNAEGAYRFDGVPPGTYDLTYELSGFEPGKRRVTVHAGENEVPQVAMKAVRTELIVVSCGPACTDEPSSKWDPPPCKDYEFVDSLIENAERNDHSAVELLQRRYATAFTYADRFRAGGALLGRIPDDRAIWSELATHAENAVSFAGHTEKLEAYCAEHDCEADAYREMSWNALRAAEADRRARPLLLHALTSDDDSMVEEAIFAFGIQHDDSALPEIDKALQRFPKMAVYLAWFKSDAADRVAMKYVKSDEERAQYDDMRAEP